VDAGHNRGMYYSFYTLYYPETYARIIIEVGWKCMKEEKKLL